MSLSTKVLLTCLELFAVNIFLVIALDSAGAKTAERARLVDVFEVATGISFFAVVAALFWWIWSW